VHRKNLLAKRRFLVVLAYAKIGQFPPVSATPTHMLRICVNSPTMRVVDGADPYKIKSEYSKQTK
jgi:hypothetical protein